jgi:hypothetical protein
LNGLFRGLERRRQVPPLIRGNDLIVQIPDHFLPGAVIFREGRPGLRGKTKEKTQRERQNMSKFFRYHFNAPDEWPCSYFKVSGL